MSDEKVNHQARHMETNKVPESDRDTDADKIYSSATSDNAIERGELATDK
jgi:hypothetical protein